MHFRLVLAEAIWAPPEPPLCHSLLPDLRQKGPQGCVWALADKCRLCLNSDFVTKLWPRTLPSPAGS